MNNFSVRHVLIPAIYMNNISWVTLYLFRSYVEEKKKQKFHFVMQNINSLLHYAMCHCAFFQYTAENKMPADSSGITGSEPRERGITPHNPATQNMSFVVLFILFFSKNKTMCNALKGCNENTCALLRV